RHGGGGGDGAGVVGDGVLERVRALEAGAAGVGDAEGRAGRGGIDADAAVGGVAHHVDDRVAGRRRADVGIGVGVAVVVQHVYGHRVGAVGVGEVVAGRRHVDVHGHLGRPAQGALVILDRVVERVGAAEAGHRLVGDFAGRVVHGDGAVVGRRGDLHAG